MQRVLSFGFRSLCTLFVCSLALALAQELPEGPGRDETIRMCRQCHELARSISLRQDRDGWGTTMTKMVAYGMKATDEEIAVVLDYLSKHFPADEVPRVNVNRASAIQLESGLSLRRSQAAALIEYREKHGAFKTLDDLKKVPALDADHLEARRNRIEF